MDIKGRIYTLITPGELKVKKLNQAGKIHVRQSPSKFASNLSLKFKGRIAQKRS